MQAAIVTAGMYCLTVWLRVRHHIIQTIGGCKTHSSAKHITKTTPNITAPPTASKHLSQTGNLVNSGETVLQKKAAHNIGTEPENPRNGPDDLLACTSVNKTQPIAKATPMRTGPRVNTTQGIQIRRDAICNALEFMERCEVA